jgi:pimeloyl-ACP methyl ester carboxylesterase
MPFADLPDVRLFYTDNGEGPPLLLVHGWGSDSHQWSWHIESLARRHRVIAVDLRGHGRSSVPSGPYSPQVIAADLAALLHAIDVSAVVGVGHAMGAQVVSVLAVEQPRLARAVVALEAAYGVAGSTADALPRLVKALRQDAVSVAQVMEQLSFTSGTADVIRTWHTRQLAGAHEHVLSAAFCAQFVDPDAWGVRAASEAYLARRTCPVLSIWADRERAGWERRIVSHPASRVVSWPGVGHYLHEERPKEFVRELEGWLTYLSDKGY